MTLPFLSINTWTVTFPWAPSLCTVIEYLGLARYLAMPFTTPRDRVIVFSSGGFGMGFPFSSAFDFARLLPFLFPKILPQLLVQPVRTREVKFISVSRSPRIGNCGRGVGRDRRQYQDKDGGIGSHRVPRCNCEERRASG